MNQSENRFQLVVLISGSGSNLQAIIDAIAAGRLHARISAVISNQADAYGLQRAAAANIATHVVSHQQFTTRDEFDQQLMTIIDGYQPDLVVLAGFMRILSDQFVLHYDQKMINIHPSLLPKYKGLHTHRRALAAGDSEHGLSIHFVTPDLDSGPIIKQVKVAVYDDDDEHSLAARVLEQEHKAYPQVIQWLAEQSGKN